MIWFDQFVNDVYSQRYSKLYPLICFKRYSKKYITVSNKIKLNKNILDLN